LKISFKKGQSKSDILKKVSELSINERQCVAIICFERYCRKNMIVHKDIEVFIEHVWKVVQIEKNFCEWAEKFGQLAITGQGDPFPEDLIKAIPHDLLYEFNLLVECVYETSATCWYAAESEDSSKMLIKIFEIMSKHCIPIPDISFYRDSSKKSPDGWSPAVSQEKLNIWRSTV